MASFNLQVNRGRGGNGGNYNSQRFVSSGGNAIDVVSEFLNGVVTGVANNRSKCATKAFTFCKNLFNSHKDVKRTFPSALTPAS